MDSGGPEQITVMSDCTKACACVHRISLFPPSCAALDVPLSTPCFFFPPFSFCSCRFARIPPSCRFSLLWSSGWSQLVGGQQLFFAGNRNPLCGKKKRRRWDYLSQHYLPIIFMCWCLCSCSTGCLSSLLLRSRTNKQWRCQAVKPKCIYIKCNYLTNGEIITE